MSLDCTAIKLNYSSQQRSHHPSSYITSSKYDSQRKSFDGKQKIIQALKAYRNKISMDKTQGKIPHIDFNSQLVKKQYIEVVQEKIDEDKLKTHQQIMQEVFDTLDNESQGQLQKVKKHFKARSFDPLEANKLLRNEYLDTYFKDTYIEWGTRWYLEKIQTRTNTNAVMLLMKKLTRGNELGMKGGNSLIDRIISQNSKSANEREQNLKDVKSNHEKSLAKHVLAAMNEEENERSSKTRNLLPQQLRSAEFFRQYCSKRKAFLKYKRDGLTRVSDECENEIKRFKQSVSPKQPNQAQIQLEQPKEQQFQSKKIEMGRSFYTLNQNQSPKQIVKKQTLSDLINERKNQYESIENDRDIKSKEIDISSNQQHPQFFQGSQVELKLPPSITRDSRNYTLISASSTVKNSIQQHKNDPQNEKSRNNIKNAQSVNLTSRNRYKQQFIMDLNKDVSKSTINETDYQTPNPQMQTYRKETHPGRLASTLLKFHNDPYSLVKTGFKTSRNQPQTKIHTLRSLKQTISRPSPRLTLNAISVNQHSKQSQDNLWKQETKEKQKQIVLKCRDLMSSSTYQDPDEVVISSHHESVQSSTIGSLPSTKKDILPYKLYLEECKRERFNRTLDLVKELEQYEPHQVKQLYNYKLTGILEEEQEARNVSYEYKLGMMDPSREAAMLEKQKANRRQIMINKNRTKATTVNFY